MIKASDILESITFTFRLDERNIYNIQEVDDWIEQTIRTHSEMNQEIKKWLRSVVRNYLFNVYPHVELVTDKNRSWIVTFGDIGRDWVERSIKSRNLYKLNLHDPAVREFRLELWHIIDYLYDVFDNEDLPQDLKVRDISRLSFDAASKKAAEWIEWLNKKESEGWEEGEKKVFKTSDGFVVKEVFSHEALNREGKEMQHCVGSYADLVDDGETTIYSLRDSSNNPHVTIEMTRGEVLQIKGKQNREPIEKYHRAVIEFLNWLEPRHVEDLENVGGVEYEGEFYQEDDLPVQYWKSREGIENLCKLVEDEDVERVETLLRAGVDFNVSNYEGRFPFYIASMSSESSDIFDLLVEDKRVDVNLQNRYGSTALMAMIQYDQDHKWVEKLLKRQDTDPNIRGNSQGASALSIAAFSDSREFIKMLLRNPRTNPNIQSDDGRTPLLVAASNDCIDAVEELLKDKRVNIELKDGKGKSLLDYLKEGYVSNKSHQAIFRLLEKYRGIKQNDFANFLLTGDYYR